MPTTTRRTSTQRAGQRPARTRRPANKDILTMLKDDHRTVESLFRRYERLGPRAEKGRMDIVRRLAEELRVHTRLEETILYPVMREALRSGDKKVKEAVHEHDEADYLVKKLKAGRPLADGYDELVAKLKAAIKHHVSEEEKELWPQLRNHLSRAELLELAEQARAFKRKSGKTK